ncbi:hypothetical protein JRQ81_009604 [Phrynocephalus forsythii]|uniref:Galectin n=1 Tax=Phrynocephalus forsythii TaxID=171643 RepID=A0A9Q0XDF8_9SAUR|nr:hypothetical protein JRQ81_009604 [Phrynocephalus forsythii]
MGRAAWCSPPPPHSLQALPYMTTIFGGLVLGKMVSVQGVVSVEAERFQVDFQVGCSVSPRADIGLHFNPRFRPRPHVICNSLVHGRWMEETKLAQLPLRRGDSFQLLFLFQEDHAKVSVNGHHFAQAPFKVPLAQMDTLAVSGDVLVKSITFFPKNPFLSAPSRYPAVQPLLMSSPELEVPLTHALPKGFGTGDAVTLRGMVLHDPQEVRVCLKTQGSSRPLWCFRVSFLDRTVSWGSDTEEEGQDPGMVLAPSFPFHPQRYFELLFLHEGSHVKVAVNGTPSERGPALSPPHLLPWS